MKPNGPNHHLSLARKNDRHNSEYYPETLTTCSLIVILKYLLRSRDTNLYLFYINQNLYLKWEPHHYDPSPKAKREGDFVHQKDKLNFSQ